MFIYLGKIHDLLGEMVNEEKEVTTGEGCGGDIIILIAVKFTRVILFTTNFKKLYYMYLPV